MEESIEEWKMRMEDPGELEEWKMKMRLVENSESLEEWNRSMEESQEEWKLWEMVYVGEDLVHEDDLRPGDLIRDVEDGDLYYEGVWQGDGTYTVTRDVCNDEEFAKSVGRTQRRQWYWIHRKTTSTN